MGKTHPPFAPEETWLYLPKLFTVKHPDKTVQTKGRQCLCSGCVQRSGFPWRCISQRGGEAQWKARPAQDSQGVQVAQIRSNWGQRRTDLAKEQISISYLINSKALPTPLRIQNPHSAYQVLASLLSVMQQRSSPGSLCCSHTGPLAVPTPTVLIPASEPLHVLFPLPGMPFTRLSSQPNQVSALSPKSLSVPSYYLIFLPNAYHN